jgi:large subunit ribosomal protein L10
MVSEKKKTLVQDLIKLIKEHKIVGIVNLENLPAQQLQKMKSTLLSKGVTLLMARKRLLKKALEDSGNTNILQLADTIRGMPALLFANDNPFTLYSLLQKNKSEAPAKEGQTAPKDIIVKGGATNFAPGPIISELAAVGIKTKVDNGKLAIISDVIVAKEGDKISAKLAETLKRLDLKPMEVGLDLVAVWEDGFIFKAKDLHVDEQEVSAQFSQAHTWAFNLAMETAYPCQDTIEPLFAKAFREAKTLAIEQNIISKDVIDEILSKAQRSAVALKSEVKVE